MRVDDMPATWPAACPQCGGTFTARRYNVTRGKDRFCSQRCGGLARWSTAPSLFERFWEKVDRNGPIPAHCPELGPCWIWLGTRGNNGYGLLYAKSLGLGTLRAHHVSYEIHFGSLVSGAWVLHHCDNPPCVRPDHLFAGTQVDNMKDMAAKGRNGRQSHPERFPVGSAIKQSKLTEPKVLEMRQARADGVELKVLALRYDVSLKTVKGIVYGKQWKHVGGPITNNGGHR